MPRGVAPAPGGPGVHHFAFQVDSEVALRDAYFGLRDQGVEIARAVDHVSQKSIYFHDPDGTKLEIYYELPNARELFRQGRGDRAVAEEKERAAAAAGKEAASKEGPGKLPVGERVVLDWVEGQGGLAIISDTHGKSIARVGGRFTKMIERENRNRFFRRNLGYVIGGLVMTAAVIGGVLAFGGLQDQDLAVIDGIVFFGFIVGMFLFHVAHTFFSGASLNALIRGMMSIIFFAIFFSIANSLIKEWSPKALVDALPSAWAYVEHYPFSFVLVGAFAVVNGLFSSLLRAPTALGSHHLLDR